MRKSKNEGTRIMLLQAHEINKYDIIQIHVINGGFLAEVVDND